jgi:KDO2-lipid IV(A) lauroyltransferase
VNPQVLLPWCSPLAAALPRRTAETLADVLGGASRGGTQLAANLARALGAPAPAPVLRRARQSYARYYLSAMRLAHASVARAAGGVGVEGAAEIERSLARRRGVLVLSAHFGNWDLAGIALAQSFGGICVFAEALRPQRLARFYARLRQRHGVRVVHAGSASRLPVQVLQANGVLGVMADRAFGGRAVRVPFGAAGLEVPTAAIRLALRHGSGVHAVLCGREAGGYILRIGADLGAGASDDAAGVRRVASAFAAALFERVRRDPGQWCHLYPLTSSRDAACASLR